MGFLKVSENGRYFTKDETPFFWLGDTIWPAPSMYSEEELEFYFSARQEQGFTVVHIMLPWASDGGGVIIKDADGNDDYLPFWLNNNPATPNEEYFKKVDRLIKIASRHYIIIVILACGGGCGTFVGQKKMITADNARAYAKWLAERYKDEQNIVWSNGFDEPPWLDEDVAREFAAGIREGDGGNHLMFYHPCGGYSSNHFHGEEWLSANFIQTWGDYRSIQRMVLADYHRKPRKPAVHAEGAYEAGIEYPTPITAHLVRRQAYDAYLSGGFHTYGHNDLWRKTPYWRDCLNSKGARSIKILKDIFASLEWWKLMPDQSLFDIWAPEAHAASISEDRDFAVIYFAFRVELPICTGRVGNGGPVRAIWIDPEDGRQVCESVVSGKVHTFSVPASCDDAVLILKGCRDC